MAAVKAVEKILSYSRSAVGAYDGVPQQRSWDCCPAAVQVIMQACGVNVDEQYLIDKIGTTVNGTNHAGLACPILNEKLTGSGYVAVWLPTDPPSDQEKETFWANLTRSIDAGRGVLINFEAPPTNFPKGANGSTSPQYRGLSTIFHYVAGMGYAVDKFGNRYVWIADPGFPPFGYFVTLEQCVILIAPHAYAYSSTAPVLSSPATVPTPTPTPVPTPTPAPSPVVPNRWAKLLQQIWNQFRG